MRVVFDIGSSVDFVDEEDEVRESDVRDVLLVFEVVEGVGLCRLA